MKSVENLLKTLIKLKKVFNEQKRLKTAEKSSLTSFGCAQHPKADRNTHHMCPAFQLDLKKESKLIF